MAGPLQEEKFHPGNIIFFFSFLIGIAITKATQCLVYSNFQWTYGPADFVLAASQYYGVNRPKRALTYHEKDVTVLFIIYIILLAGSSRDDHTNQPKRQVMCYHRNKDDFLM